MGNYKKTKEKFINPYYFVPLSSKCHKDGKIIEVLKQNNLKTGWIKCELITKSLLFVPNPTNNDVYKIRIKEKKIINSYEFYSYDDLIEGPKENIVPIIPGSEIRGTLRSAFEALTNSCLSTLDNKKILYKRVPYPADPGMIKIRENGAVILPCERYKVPMKKWGKNSEYNMYEIFEEGNKAYFKAVGDKVIDLKKEGDLTPEEIRNQGYEQGYMHFGEHFGDKSRDKRNNESVFKISEDKKEIQIDEKTAFDLLIKNIKLYRNDGINVFYKPKNRLHHGYNHIKIENTAYPDKALIYYQKYTSYNAKTNQYKEKYYLNPGQIGREMFYNTLHEIAGTYAPCTRLSDLCPTCKLFGLIGTKEEQSMTSRVRVTDAICHENTSKSLFQESLILPELASPNLSSTEFYLDDPLPRSSEREHIWNYDYAFQWNNGQKNPIPDYKPKLRGRKFYWHHTFNPKIQIKEDDATELHTKIYPLNPGVKFEFKIYFDHITDMELKQLLWTLELGGEQRGHKLGKGKPFGLGSIQLKVLQVQLRDISLNNKSINYNIRESSSLLEEIRRIKTSEEILSLFGHENSEYTNYQQILEIFLDLTDRKFLSKYQSEINYPENIPKASTQNLEDIEKEKASFNWFTANRIEAFTPKICQALPDDPSEPFLYKYQEKEEEERDRKGKRREKAKKKGYNARKHTGTIIELNPPFGTIEYEGNKKLPFFRYNVKESGNIKALRVGDTVTFTIGRHKGRPDAKDIRLEDKH